MGMKTDRRRFVASSLLTAGALAFPSTAQDKTTPSTNAQIVSLRGKVICLTEELPKLYQIIPDCETRGHVYTLKTAAGGFHPFLPVDTAAAIWMDERFRQRDLQVTARSFPATDFIEVIKLQSWRDGKLHDLYYFCDICYISSHKPGPCECCQEPVEFRETPAEDNNP
jgi:hypothetical protein